MLVVVMRTQDIGGLLDSGVWYVFHCDVSATVVHDYDSRFKGRTNHTLFRSALKSSGVPQVSRNGRTKGANQ